MRGGTSNIVTGLALTLLAAGLLVLVSCKDKNPTGPEGSPSDVIVPNDSVSYSHHVQPLFKQSCNFAGCHDDGQNQSPLKLTSYGNTVLSIPGVVVPRNPDGSLLGLRIQGSLGQRMPPSGYPLNQNQFTGIRTWIAEGARNN